MAITEIALLPLTTPWDPSNTSASHALRTKLLNAKRILESASGHSFYYYHPPSSSPQSSPPVLHLFGTWPSLQTHHAFLESEENKYLLELLKDDINIAGIEMFHLDADILRGEPSVINGAFLVLARCREEGAGEGARADTEKGTLKLGLRIEKREDGKKEWLYFGTAVDKEAGEVLRERLEQGDGDEVVRRVVVLERVSSL